MGSWGVDSFGNDDAADWAWQLDDSSDLTLVEATLERASVSVDTYLEAPAACEGVALVSGSLMNTLDTVRLRLRLPEASDAEPMMEIHQDPEVIRSVVLTGAVHPRR